MKHILLLAMLLSSLPLHASTDLKSLLNLKPGDEMKYKQVEGQDKELSFEIEEEKNKIESVRIDFFMPKDSKDFLKDTTEGFCFVQKPEGHSRIDRYFFFDVKTMRRYELTPNKQIKSVLIQDIPGARAHEKCTFAKFTVGVRK